MNQIQTWSTFFKYDHLPAHLQAVSKPFGDLASALLTEQSNPEREVALRKLLEAKDAAVRAVLVDKPLAQIKNAAE